MFASDEARIQKLQTLKNWLQKQKDYSLQQKLRPKSKKPSKQKHTGSRNKMSKKIN
jgi:hypothetical protein